MDRGGGGGRESRSVARCLVTTRAYPSFDARLRRNRHPHDFLPLRLHRSSSTPTPLPVAGTVNNSQSSALFVSPVFCAVSSSHFPPRASSRPLLRPSQIKNPSSSPAPQPLSPLAPIISPARRQRADPAPSRSIWRWFLEVSPPRSTRSRTGGHRGGQYSSAVPSNWCGSRGIPCERCVTALALT